MPDSSTLAGVMTHHATVPMTCPHGCKPERYLTELEAFQFLRAAVAIGY
jgi:hypothetical protein